MKNLSLILLTSVVLCGCGTTFEQRKAIYIAIYNKSHHIAEKVGSYGLKMYLKKKVEQGEITSEQARAIYIDILTED